MNEEPQQVLYKDNYLQPRIHGNTHHLPHNALTYESLPEDYYHLPVELLLPKCPYPFLSESLASKRLTICCYPQVHPRGQYGGCTRHKWRQ